MFVANPVLAFPVIYLAVLYNFFCNVVILLTIDYYYTIISKNNLIYFITKENTSTYAHKHAHNYKLKGVKNDQSKISLFLKVKNDVFQRDIQKL